MRKKISCIIFLVMLLVSGCGNSNENRNNTKHVVVTSYVLADFAKQLGGTQFKTTVLLSPGENPKKHELTQRDRNFISHADIFIYNGDIIDPWVGDYIKSGELKNENLVIINATEDVKLSETTYADKTLDTDYVLRNIKETRESPGPTYVPEHNSEDMYVKDGNGDIVLDENFEPVLKDRPAKIETPDIENNNKRKSLKTAVDCSSIWMSPDNAAIMVKNIFNGLYDVEDLNMDIIDSSYREYSELIKTLAERIRLIAGNSACRFVVVEGQMDCFYLLDFIGFDYMSVSGQGDLSDHDREKRKAFILDFLKKNPEIKCLFSENVTPQTQIPSNLKRHEINSISFIEKKDYNKKDFSYYEIMQQNCEILKNII